jgi:type I restriction enzyme M protein
MLSPQLRNKVHGLWTMFWTAGMTNPLVAVEQITYLLFLRQLERLDSERVKTGKTSIYAPPGMEHRTNSLMTLNYDQCRWSYIRQNVSFQLLNDVVFPWLRNLEEWLLKNSPNGDDPLRKVSGRLNDAYFVLDPNKTTTLTNAVQTIDELFRQLDSRSANADIMGDVFEYLLGEIESAGKNGQFRTPRQVIRFMVELLDPPWEIREGNKSRPVRILDPACGTCGFLVNTLLHWRKKTTAPDVIRLEWDGTPHRTFGDGTLEKLPLDTMFGGYDNDRSMVRIGWMNLILHGLEFPRIEQRDSLSKRMPEEESGTYDFVLANPPFTGSVDEADLSNALGRFPSAAKGGKPITTKSELLFVWLMLDLLRVGGRAAVVVPDGVLFGSTNAHRELRRQLLFENTLEAVISLPAGVFLPYAGVKTSILVFQKASEKVAPSADPRTREVWFYEIADEAFTLDQKRSPRFDKDNDLWDALEKFKGWRDWKQADYPKAFENKRDAHREQATTSKYFQPGYWKDRWRVVDDNLLAIFPEQTSQKGQILSAQELFSVVVSNDYVDQKLLPKLYMFVQEHLRQLLRKSADEATAEEWRNNAPKLCDKTFRELGTQITKLVREEKLLDREFDQFGWNALQRLLTFLKLDFKSRVTGLLDAAENVETAQVRTWSELQPELREIVREFAKLDGYDVWLRHNRAQLQDGKRIVDENGAWHREPVQLSWIVPVRGWSRLDSWGKDPATNEEIRQGTHDAKGVVRQDYLNWLRDKLKVFDTDGMVKEEFRDRLEPACIEATDLNLSASRHKPFTLEAGKHRPPAELIRELDGIYTTVRAKLGRLLEMVEGKE